MPEDPRKSLPEHEEIQGSIRQGQAHHRTSVSNAVPVLQRNSVGHVQHEEMYQLEKRIVGGSRLDPFVRWPINLTEWMQYLLDHRTFLAGVL